MNKYTVEKRIFFQLNEKLKEELVLNHKAYEAKTIFFKKGVSIVPYPFFESISKWDKDVDERHLTKAMLLILKYRKKINEFCEMSEPVFETSHGNPQIVWAIFLDE